MNGQWIGRYTGAATGAIHVNVDERETGYLGVAYLFSDTPKMPITVAFFTTPNKESEFSIRTEPLQTVDLETAATVSWETVKDKYPHGIVFSKYADVRGSFDENNLTLSWTTEEGGNGDCVLPRSKADQPSELIPLEMDWGTYKEHVIELASKRLLFRGQSSKWRLRTPFHRSGRANLLWYVRNDIPQLHQYLSARTKHVFKLHDHEEYGAFISLLQHHGYPTPVLDWTYSPYVAAFFAYRGISNEQASSAGPDAKVRILIFDAAEWVRRWAPVTLLVHPQLHVTVREFMPIENTRMIPQQAVSTVSSVDDIETYIKERGTNDVSYLRAIDLPMRERRSVFRELMFMGLTAGSLFPGLDGTCEELAERHFNF
jgi:hypothetical protein